MPRPPRHRATYCHRADKAPKRNPRDTRYIARDPAAVARWFALYRAQLEDPAAPGHRGRVLQLSVRRAADRAGEIPDAKTRPA